MLLPKGYSCDAAVSLAVMEIASLRNDATKVVSVDHAFVIARQFYRRSNPHLREGDCFAPLAMTLFRKNRNLLSLDEMTILHNR